MTFSRDDLATYEKQPQTQVAESAATKNAPPAVNEPATDVEATPSGDDVSNSENQPVVGEDGTSDENADSSTATADPSGESESTEDGTNKTGDEAPVAKVPPKKGSAAERVQEVLDLAEGYKEFGRTMQDQLKEALAENARLKGGGTPAPKTDTAEPPARVEDDVMPDLTDPDVNFDTDKLRVKTQKWVDARIEKGTERAISKLNGSSEAAKIKTAVETRVTAFAATHPDWETVVAKNATLIANQLHPAAARAVAESEDVAEILYKFGQNTALAIKVAKLPVEKQLVQLGEIMAEVRASKQASVNTDPKTTAAGAKPAKQKSLTDAPPPPTPTRAAGRATVRETTDPSMSMDDFAKQHRAGKQAARDEARKRRGG